MRILDFYGFAALPEGTIFSYLELMACRGLYRKGATIFDEGSPIDFFEASLIAACCRPDEPPKVDDVQSRWGCYDYSQEFIVYEHNDITILVRQLTA